MIDFIEYRDDKIRIKLPKQLRQQRSKHLFRGNLVRRKPESNVMVAVSIDLNETQRKIYLEPEKRQPAVLPASYKVLRSGPCSFGDGGRELFTSSEIFDKGYTLYTWQVVYCLQNRYIMLSVMGGGTCENFERMAKEIIKSLTLESFPQMGKSLTASSYSIIKNKNRGGMQTKDKMRLQKELKLLPENLKYLHDPILSTADEDQDLLNCGDIDTTLLAKVIQQQATLDPKGCVAKQAEELEQWLTHLSTPNEAWAAPLWFVLGFLKGHDIFCDE